MTETHARRKRALSQQQKLIEHKVNTEKQQWSTTLLLMQQKMQSSIKQLQREHVMWRVLSQEAELRCEDAQLKVHRQKSNSSTLVQMQVDKAIRKERDLKSYILELQEIHVVQLLREQKAKRVTIQSSKHW
jgi:mannose-6-phosphate isomerase-like protein (cupin superfamily)